MMEKSVIINLEKGLEARPVAQLVQVASQYESKIFILDFAMFKVRCEIFFSSAFS